MKRRHQAGLLPLFLVVIHRILDHNQLRKKKEVMYVHERERKIYIYIDRHIYLYIYTLYYTI